MFFFDTPVFLVGAESFTKTATDTLGLDDGGTVDLSWGFDALGLTDSVTASTAVPHERTATDNLGLTDSVTAQDVVIRFEFIGWSDSIVQAWVGQREATDFLGLTDSVIADLDTGTSFNRTQVESLGLTDSVQVQLIAIHDRSQTDPVDLTDSILVETSSPTAHTAEPTDNLGLTDSVTALISIPSVWEPPVGVPGTTLTLSGVGTTVAADPEN